MLDLQKIERSKFYQIHELESALALPGSFILKSAISSKYPNLRLCIFVPDECVVYSVNMASINHAINKGRLNRISSYKYPDPSIHEEPQFESRGKVVALVLDKDVLVEVEKNWPSVKSEVFQEAYMVDDKYQLPAFRFLKLIRPRRMYSVDVISAVASNLDSGLARFALYLKNADVNFVDGYGYTDTFDLPVRSDLVYVLGSDFIEWLTQVDDFDAGNIRQLLGINLSTPDDLPLEDHVLADSGLSVLSGGVAMPLRPKKIRMNDFRIQVMRAASSIMKERKISAAEVYADDLLRFFNDEANKEGSDFFFKKVSVAGNKKELFFRDSTGNDIQISKKKITSCLNGLVDLIHKGLLRPEGD